MLLPFEGVEPSVAESAWVAPSAELIGDVSLHEESSIWYAAVLRADFEGITIGARSNLQDGVVVHTDTGFPTVLGEGVSVGHRAVLHGCRIEDNVLVGMGSVVLNGASIGRDSLVAAGAVVSEGAVVPPRSLVAGVPAKFKRELLESDLERLRRNADIYVALAARHAAAHAIGSDGNKTAPPNA